MRSRFKYPTYHIMRDPSLLTIYDVAKRLNTTKEKVQDWIDLKQLPWIFLDGEVVIPLRSLEYFEKLNLKGQDT